MIAFYTLIISVLCLYMKNISKKVFKCQLKNISLSCSSLKGLFIQCNLNQFLKCISFYWFITREGLFELKRIGRLDEVEKSPRWNFSKKSNNNMENSISLL